MSRRSRRRRRKMRKGRKNRGEKKSAPAALGRERTKGERKRLTRCRRTAVESLLDAGRSVAQVARELKCDETTVRQHATALREAAQRRAVAEWGPGARDTGDLVEGLELALQKVRAALRQTDRDKPTYRGLLQLEIRTIQEMMVIRRELAAARKNRDTSDVDPYEWMSNEELVAEARSLGIDVSPFKDLLRDTKPEAA